MRVLAIALKKFTIPISKPSRKQTTDGNNNLKKVTKFFEKKNAKFKIQSTRTSKFIFLFSTIKTKTKHTSYLLYLC